MAEIEISPQAQGERIKDPKKVAAGKARAAQAAAARAATALIPPAPKKKIALPFDGLKMKIRKKPKLTQRAKPGPKPRGVPSASAMVVVAFRVLPAQKRKLEKLGGGEFVRNRIDRATV